MVRVRFAPSPTGPLHIGGVRTALYNYLFAKKNNGTFILRIEDTDQTRYVPGAEEYIVNSLKWCGITFDEGVTAGGPHAPYRQSERKEIYKKYAEQLVNQGNAYYAFDTPEDLENLRKELEEQKAENTSYAFHVRMKMQNSISLPADVVAQKLQSGEPYVIRFKMPENEMIEFNDLIREDVKVNSSTLDDKVLFKSDGLPTYHLANVVDDHLMEITHVIRGEEWLPSTPLHVMLYKSFGWKMPLFSHLPLLLKPSGKGKLSKRDGDQLGFPVFPLEWKSPEGEISSGYRESGYLRDAFINMLALLGWNPGTEQEIFSLQELAEIFTIDRVGKSGSRFDPEKAKWFNHQYLQKLTNSQIAELFIPLLESKSIKADFQTVERIAGMMKERVNFVYEIWDQAFYFFQAPESYDDKTVKKRWNEQTPELMLKVIDILSNTSDFSSQNTESLIKDWVETSGIGFGPVMNPLRLCIVGAATGPHLFDITEIIGKEETIKRIRKALEVIG